MTSIRVATDQDLPEMADIYNHYITHTTATFEEAVISVSMLQQRVEHVQASGLPWFVFENQEGVLGYAYARPWNSRTAYRYTAEVSIYVSPKAGGQGIGSELYCALFEALQQQSIQQIIAVITLPNAPSIALHEKLGFFNVAHLNQVGFKFGQWLDVGYWQKRLEVCDDSI